MLGGARHVGIVVFASSVLAEIVPTTPTEDEIFHTGDQCTMSWNPDTAPDGWNTMRIDLMTGNQPGLTLVTGVADSVDSTSSGPGWYSWTCPTVDFDGPVYSYMFSPSDGPDPPVFSPQFTITGFDGSVELPDVSSSLPLATPTDVADPSSGAAHIGNPVPNSSSGEEMLEYIDQRLGGADTSPGSDNANSQANFLAQAMASDAQAAINQPPVTSVTHVHLLDQSTQTITEGQAAAESTTTQTRMLTLVSSSTTASASAASPSHTASTSADASFRQTGSMSGAIILALFILCAGHLFME